MVIFLSAVDAAGSLISTSILPKRASSMISSAKIVALPTCLKIIPLWNFTSHWLFALKFTIHPLGSVYFPSSIHLMVKRASHTKLLSILPFLSTALIVRSTASLSIIGLFDTSTRKRSGEANARPNQRSNTVEIPRSVFFIIVSIVSKKKVLYRIYHSTIQILLLFVKYWSWGSQCKLTYLKVYDY